MEAVCASACQQARGIHSLFAIHRQQKVEAAARQTPRQHVPAQFVILD
jgi:hypothetical protein